jgi:hexosaminidase
MRLARLFTVLLLVVPAVAAVTGSAAAAASTLQDVVPAPASVQPAAGVTYTLPSSARIHAAPGATTVADQLAALLRASTGYALPVIAAGAPSDGIALLLSGADPRVGPEGYQLDVTADAVVIRAQTAAGLFHGVQTLRQLLPAAVERRSVQPGPWTVPGGRIIDHPRFGYRGAMLDVARHFQPVATVKRYIEQLALYKINHLHLHLSDDQGWRIAVDSWPRLATHGGSTQVGGGPGGYYTKAQYTDIVAHASRHHITIVPEIDMPGHTTAALASYAELNCNGIAPPLYTGTEVGFSSLCVPAEITYRFIDDVIRELTAMTPGPYIHIGGDEAHATPANDYATFARRAQDIVAARGRTVIGWHQIGAAEHKAGRIVQYWGTGTADSLISDAAERGAKVLMSPANKAYLDMKYNAASPLGLNWAGYVEVRDAYEWNPGTRLSGVAEASVLGVEAPLWAETVSTRTDIDYLAFPRLPAIAELGWSPWSTHNWDAFRLRLAAHGPRWTALGIGYHRSPQIPWAPNTDPTTLVGQASGRCLDVIGNTSASGAAVAIWDCHGEANQRWTLTTAGELRVTIGGVTKCLDAYGSQTANGTAIQIWNCHGRANQRWTINANSQIVGEQSGKCLDVYNGEKVNGSAVKLYTCASSTIGNQAFIRA